jgi:hypothetical protein
MHHEARLTPKARAGLRDHEGLVAVQAHRPARLTLGAEQRIGIREDLRIAGSANDTDDGVHRDTVGLLSDGLPLNQKCLALLVQPRALRTSTPSPAIRASKGGWPLVAGPCTSSPASVNSLPWHPQRTM